jgi:glycosyltransferase involved in cell wall biosynthesis
MKINIILPALGQSGGSKVIYKYAKLLKQRGHDVVIYKQIISYNMHRYSFFLNIIHVLYCTLKIIANIKNRNKEFDKYVFKISNKSIRNSDCVIATAWPTAYTVDRLSDIKGKKYYFIQDFEIWDNFKYGLQSYRLPLEKIVISTWINKQLKKYLDIGPFPIVLNGIEVGNINFKKNNKKIHILMLNHTLEKKGIRDGLFVVEKIKNSYPEIVVKMFGMCDSSNLPSFIKYYENPDEETLNKLYDECDIFIFPSLEEGWGLTPIEAMSHSAAVVGNDVGFVLDIGKNRENMLVNESGDKVGLYSLTKELVNNKYLREKIAQNGYETVKKLNWNYSMHQLEKILNE